MTVDDESSVYVGGLSYDTTEDSLRKTFEEYGSVVAVKPKVLLGHTLFKLHIVQQSGDLFDNFIKMEEFLVQGLSVEYFLSSLGLGFPDNRGCFHKVPEHEAARMILLIRDGELFLFSYHGAFTDNLNFFKPSDSMPDAFDDAPTILKSFSYVILRSINSPRGYRDQITQTIVMGISYHAPFNRIYMTTTFISRLLGHDLIILDRESGSSRGYGFVTFSTPRAATKAINGMDGGLLNGRTVRVNEVMNKGGRAFGRDNGFRERDRDRDNREFRSRDRSGNIRQFSPQRNRRLSPGSLHSNRGRLPMRHHSRSPQGGYSPSRSSSPLGKRNNHSSLSPSPRSSDRLQGADILPVGLAKIGRRGDKERGLDLIKVKDELEKANQRRDELSIKVASLEEENELKEEQIIELRNKSQKLENAVSNAVTASSQRQIQLRKLQKAFLQVRDYTERLQQSEKELQALIDVTGIEANDAGIEFQENHGRDLEDIEWKADDRGHINIDD